MKTLNSKQSAQQQCSHKNPSVFLLAIVTLTMLIFTLASCASSNPKTAILDEDAWFFAGYEKPFYELILNSVEKQIGTFNSSIVKVTYEINVENGWKASSKLNQNTLNNDETAITFSIEVEKEFVVLGIKDKITTKYFMIHDTSDNSLRVKGAFLDADGESQEIDREEAIKNIQLQFSVLTEQ